MPRAVHYARGAHAIVVGRGNLELNLERIALSARGGLGEAAEELCAAVKDYAPKKTGRLASEIYVSKILDLDEGHWRVEIVAPTEYAPAQERGSGLYAEPRPGVIRALIPIFPESPLQALTFRWPNAPARLTSRYKHMGIVFLRYVLHPGVKGTAFMRRALRDNSSRIWTRILEASARIR